MDCGSNLFKLIKCRWRLYAVLLEDVGAVVEDLCGDEHGQSPMLVSVCELVGRRRRIALKVETFEGDVVVRRELRDGDEPFVFSVGGYKERERLQYVYARA